MAQKLALVLIILSVSCIAINADPTIAKPLNYNVTPAAEFNISTDSGIIQYAKAIFVPGFDNTTIFVYRVNFSSWNSTISLDRRSISASTLEVMKDAGVQFVATIPTINNIWRPVVGLGYLGIVSVDDSNGKLPEISLYYAAVNGSLKTVKLMSSNNKNITYYVGSAWYESGYFYITITQFNSSWPSLLEQAAYIQAVKVSDGSTLFTEPVKVATLNETVGRGYVFAGPTNSSNSSTINVLYKTNTANSTYLVTLKVKDGAVSSPVALFTDRENITYTPAGTLGSSSNSAVFVRETNSSVIPAVNRTYGFFNGNTTPVLVADSSKDGFYAPFVSGREFADGYVLFEAYPDANGRANDIDYYTYLDYRFDFYLDYYFANRTRNGSAQVPLGTYDMGLQTFVDANGALWGGYFVSDRDLISTYLGKIMGQIRA